MSEMPKPRKVYLTIMSALATGWLPWGVKWKPWLAWAPPTKWPTESEDGRRGEKTISGAFVLCCGHRLSRKVAGEFMAAGLLERFDNPEDPRECLRITEAGRAWLSSNWIS